MLLFVDTEFVQFNCSVEGLMSLACISEHGEHWYGINRGYPRSACSGFVREQVEPYLFSAEPDELGSLPFIGLRLCDWLERFSPTEVRVVVDCVGDWYLLKELFAEAGCEPANLARRPVSLQECLPDAWVYPDVREAFLSRYFEQHKLARHNALADARANQAFWAAAQRSPVAPPLLTEGRPQRGQTTR